MVNNFVIEYLYIYHNYKHNSKDYDERGIGIYLINGRYTAVILRNYF